MLRLLRPSPLTFFTGAAILVLTSVFLLETGFTPSLHYHSSRSAQNGEGTSSSALRQLLDHSRGAKEQSGLASPRYEEFGPSGVSVEQERSFQEIRSEFHVRSPFQGSLSDSDLKMPMLLPQSEFGGEIVTESEPMTGKPGTTTEDASYEWEEQELDLIKTPVVDMLHKLSPDTTNKYAINSKPISGTIGSMFQNTSEFLPEDRFAIRDPFHLPFPAYTLPLSELTTKPWFTELKKYLSNMSPKVAPVGVVTSDFKFRQILINWLINALVRVSPPVENVIVFSLDEPLHDILKTRGIPCVYIPPEDFMNPRVHLYRHLAFTHVMVMRLTVMRLINHWGFDAINYDSDAIVLKNLAAVFEQYKESDVITSSGKYPKEVRDMWGVTACAGLWMARSSQRTELFWEALSPLLSKSSNDQAKLNVALYYFNLIPTHTPKNYLQEAWVGRGREGLTLTILPGLVVCRQACTRKLKGHYFIWHKGGSGGPGKVHYASQGGLWVVREDWEEVEGGGSGAEWLDAVSTHKPQKMPRKRS